MPEGSVIRALQDGDATTVGKWARELLFSAAPEQLPAPAVRHPLDFICLPLYRCGEKGLCLHVWEEGGEVVSPVVHAHSWDLWSYVWCGTILNQVMAVNDESESPEYRLYKAENVDGVDVIRATGSLVACTPEAPQEIQAGQIYRMASGVFHRSGHRGLTATIVLGEHHEGRDNLVLGPVNGEPRNELPREACSPQEIRDLLQRIPAR